CVLLGVGHADTERDADALCRKIVGLRIFEDEAGRFARSLDEVGGALLVISQFTLYGDCRKGRRPSFTDAAPPERAERLYEHFVLRARDGAVPVATGRFWARTRPTSRSRTRRGSWSRSRAIRRAASPWY